MACLRQYKGNLGFFFMVVFSSLDIANPAHRKFSTLCSFNNSVSAYLSH